MFAGEQVENNYGQTEQVLLLGPVLVVALFVHFRGLELGPAHFVVESPAGSRVGEPVGIAVHHGNVVLPVDLNVLFVNVADNVAGVVNGAEAYGQIPGHAHPVVDAEFPALGRAGAPGHLAVVILNYRLPMFIRVQGGHGVPDQNPAFKNLALGPGYVPGCAQFRGHSVAYQVREFLLGVLGRSAVMPNLHDGIWVAVHQANYALAALAKPSPRHDRSARFVLKASSC